MNAIDQLLANRSAMSMQPQGPSLSEMASGGWNHAEQWMNPAATRSYPGQSPTAPIRTFGSTEEDSPPGTEGTYIRGPLANPKPSPSPAPRSLEQDVPPGAGGTYYGGPLANPPRPSPTPAPRSLDMGLLKRFSWSSAFDNPASQY